MPARTSRSFELKFLPRLLAKTLKLLHQDTDIAALYHTSVGIKGRNRPLNSDILSYPFLSERWLGPIDPRRLTLGPDGLVDEYTMLDSQLGASPFYELMSALESGDDLTSHPYLNRLRAGMLDFRPPPQITEERIATTLRERFRHEAGALEHGERPLVKVALVNNKIYIADGRHRAALAALKNVAVECEDVTPIYYDSFYHWIRRKMAERPADYSRHLSFFALLHESQLRPEALSA